MLIVPLDILGEIIKQITGIAIDQYLNKIFFEPLHMKDTRMLIQDDQCCHIKMLAKSYEFDITAINPSINPVKPYWMFCSSAAGGIISTALDMMKWNHALFFGQIIPMSILNRIMLLDHVTIDNNKSYSYGLYSKIDNILGRYYYHSGGSDGFRSIIRYFPLSDIYIAFFSNVSPSWSMAHKKIEEVQNFIPKYLDEKERFSRINMILESSFPEIKINKEKCDLNIIANNVVDKLKDKIKVLV